jgi:hypothetical protein
MYVRYVMATKYYLIFLYSNFCVIIVFFLVVELRFKILDVTINKPK